MPSGLTSTNYSITFSNGALTIIGQPVIITQPTNQIANATTLVTWTVVATGAEPLSYQWSKDGVPLSDGGNISGATSSILTNSSVFAADAGTYTVEVSIPGVSGVVTSANAVLTVRDPVIFTQPISLASNPGTTVILSVVAAGTSPLSYQWNKNGDPLNNGGTVSGSTTAKLTLSSIGFSDDATYTVVVTNLVGTTTSSNATLSVNHPPTITLQPSSQTLGVGSNVVFTVVATGTAPLSYQWNKGGVTLTNIGNISGVTATNLTLSSVALSDAGTYSVTVSNVAGTATSLDAILTVRTPPSIIVPPASILVPFGGTASFSVAAIGDPVLSYQWAKNGSPISGKTTSSFTLNSLATADTATYSIVVTNAFGTASASATLLVQIPPSLTVQPPASVTAHASNSVVFLVTVGGTPPFVFQWKKGTTNLTDGGMIVGSATASLTLTNVQYLDAGSYSVVVTNVAGSVTSAPPAVLTVLSPPVITQQPQGRTIARGGSITFTVQAIGSAPLSYQWRKNGTPIAGKTNSTYSIINAPTTAAGDYTVRITNAFGITISQPATLVVSFPTATYNGLFYETNQVANRSSGFFTLTVGISYSTGVPVPGTFSGSILIEGGKYSMTGGFDINGQATIIIPRGASSTLTLALELFTSKIGQTIQKVRGSVTDGTWFSPLDGNRVFDTINQAGKFVAVLLGASDGTKSPGGDGYAIVTQLDGDLINVFNLSDNTGVNERVRLSLNKKWALYLPLYQGQAVCLDGLLLQTVESASSKEVSLGSKRRGLTCSIPADLQINCKSLARFTSNRYPENRYSTARRERFY